MTVDPGGQGIEAAAREARYAALAQIAEHFNAHVVLLGHTLDDQAETVLLGLARGSGARSLAGMRPAIDGLFHRPLLEVTRAQTEAACSAQGIEFWTDPHNSDPRFTRARVRQEMMPLLERELGPGVAAALARTADQLRADADHLDLEAARAGESARLDDGLSIVALEAMSAAIRTRVLRLAALEAGALPAELFHSHVLEMDRLVTDWHGQKWVDLPGHVRAVREGGRLTIGPQFPIVQIVRPPVTAGRAAFRSGLPGITSGPRDREIAQPSASASRERVVSRVGEASEGVPTKAPATGWSITSSTSYDEARSRISAAADSGVPMTQRRDIASSRLWCVVGDRLLLGLLDQALGEQRLAGAQRDHRLELRQREPVGFLLGVGDDGVDRQERAR